jgi:hypothetical protein
MPIARITVVSVSDEGNGVIVWGRSDSAPEDGELIGYVFRVEGERDSRALAERASRLASGTAATIDYVAVTGEWRRARGLSCP